MNRTDEFHVFNLHSHIMYLVAKAVIRERNLDPRLCAFVLTRNYKTPADDDGIPRYPFPFPNWELSFYWGKDHERIRSNIRNIEKFIDRITDGRTFHYYAQHTRSYYVNIIASYEKCIDYSFIEEGLAAYFDEQTLATLKLGKIPPKSDYDAALSNQSRLQTFDARFFNYTHPKFASAFCVAPDAFPGAPKGKRICLTDVFREIPLGESEKGDAILILDNARWNQFRKPLSLSKYEKMLTWFVRNVLQTGGYRRILYKLRHDTAPSDAALYDRVFKNHPEIKFLRIGETRIVEDIVKTLDVPVFVMASSCGKYALQMDRDVYSLAKLYARFDSGYKKSVQWSCVEHLERFGAKLIEYTPPEPVRSISPEPGVSRPVYAFDIHDTLVTRKVATPEGIFTLVQDRLRKECRAAYPSELVENFCFYRNLAEQVRCQNAGENETTLEEIYRSLHTLFNYVSWENIRRLMRMEIETEIRWTVPVEENVTKIRELLESRRRVVLIADTHLPEDVIETILENADPLLKHCPRYLSSSIGLKKSGTGRLYRHVCERENVSPQNLQHVGDDESTDVGIPQSLGINATHYKRAAIHPVECDYLLEKSLFHQLVAGVSKRFRMARPDASKLADIGATVAAPILYGYVDDVLKKAVAKGIKTLYFFARDGQVMLKIAEAINEARNWNLELRYLYCSRQSVMPAGTFWTNTELFDWVFIRFTDITFRDVAERLQLDAEELLFAFPSIVQAKITDVDAKLDDDVLGLLKFHMCKTPAVRVLIESRSKQLRELFLDYLKQEGVFDHKTVGIVDIGWKGLVQNTFFKIAASRKPGFRMHGFYFSFSSNCHHGHSSANGRENYVESILPMTGLNPVFLVNFLETLCCSDHGTTLGYERTDEGKIVPVFGDNTYADSSVIHEYHDALTWWAREYVDIEKQLPDQPFTPKLILWKLLSNCSNPHPDVAEAFGALNFSGNQNEQSQNELAPVLGVRDVLRYYLSTGNRQEISWWMPGSLARSPRFVQRLAAFLEWIDTTDARFFKPGRKRRAKARREFFKGKSWKTFSSPFVRTFQFLGGLVESCAKGIARWFSPPVRDCVLSEWKELDEAESVLTEMDLDMVSLQGAFHRTSFSVKNLEKEFQAVKVRMESEPFVRTTKSPSL